METNSPHIYGHDVWSRPTPLEALYDVAELCKEAFAVDLKVTPEGFVFQHKDKGQTARQGISSIHGKLSDDMFIHIHFELVKGIKDTRISSGFLLKCLSEFNDKTRLLPPRKEKSGHFSIWAELKVEATPLGMSRSSAFVDEIRRLDDLAKSLQAELPTNLTDAEIIKLYQGFEETLAPVNPWLEASPSDAKFLDWARETVDLLEGCSSIAVASPFPVVIDLALAIIASVSWESGKSIGRSLLPAINARGLIELTRKAPGIVTVPAIRISLGTNPYELGNEMSALLASLTDAHTPTIFTGNHEELQAIFHGGQGGKNDPLFPVLHHVPDASLDTLTRFAIRQAGQRHEGLPKSAEKELVKKTISGLKDMGIHEQKRLLPLVANKVVNLWSSGKKIPISSISSFAAKLSGLSESLSGLVSKPRARRSPNVQEHLAEALTYPGLLDFFQEHLLAQDSALEQLIARLRMECLTRPLHQPLRYCTQGTPGTGKSESASLLAKRLEIPYVNIDASSMPDYHSAASQLLGSGRGIVGSNQSGRLEQVAKHHTGVVVEVSDLDHATPSVRSTLADLFLQVLETGEAQSATGAMFSCANLIFAFTMNLPGGADEDVRKGIGFNNIPSQFDVRNRVAIEIKNMLSSAFLSRVGTPILFEPLDSNALSSIIERAVKRAIITAAERLHCPISDVVIDKDLGTRLISSLEMNILSFGARGLLEKGRSMAAEALLDLKQQDVSIAGKCLFISATYNGQIIIETKSLS